MCVCSYVLSVHLGTSNCYLRRISFSKCGTKLRAPAESPAIMQASKAKLEAPAPPVAVIVRRPIVPKSYMLDAEGAQSADNEDTEKQLQETKNSYFDLSEEDKKKNCCRRIGISICKGPRPPKFLDEDKWSDMLISLF